MVDRELQMTLVKKYASGGRKGLCFHRIRERKDLVKTTPLGKVFPEKWGGGRPHTLKCMK